jgi:DNA-binding XRE family transcriptional regulator
MTNLREIFAFNLKKNRQNSGLSQAKLAEKVSVSTHHIAMIEIGRNYPAMELVERIANVLNIEIHELFITPLSTPVEMERLYQTVAKNIEQVVSDAIEKALIDKCKKND